ncbi:MAG: metallophosphatase family protein [Lachnospiraceae bacterium]|nr:metallophosphatase family protein [Lachnospiraceae bacterium]
MGKILFLSDIHGNMPAVRALEKEMQKIQPDDVWFVGDAVGKGPENDKAVDWVRANCKHYVKGNWDDGMCKNYRTREYPDMDFFWKQLGEERIVWLESLPFEGELLVSGLWFRIVHGRPSDRLYQAYDSWEELNQGFKSKVFDRVFNAYICADSHMPYVRASQLGYAINTGSVGNSLGIPRVHALLLEGEIGSSEPAPVKFDILSIPYDNNEAIAIAEQYPELPHLDSYRNELLTGIYSR